MTSTKLKPLGLALAAAAMLSGCAQIGAVAGDLWGGTKQVAEWVAAPVSSLLRDTPEATYRFAGHEAPTTDLAEHDADTDIDIDTVTPGLTAPVQRQSHASAGRAPVATQDEMQGQALSQAEPQPTTISFVQLDGTPSMTDWQACETTSRGYWSNGPDGGGLSPVFELCMRDRGYVLESELQSHGGPYALPGAVDFNRSVADGLAGGYPPLP